MCQSAYFLRCTSWYYDYTQGTPCVYCTSTRVLAWSVFTALDTVQIHIALSPPRRFYFVSNAALLDILSNGNDPPKIQVMKCPPRMLHGILSAVGSAAAICTACVLQYDSLLFVGVTLPFSPQHANFCGHKSVEICSRRTTFPYITAMRTTNLITIAVPPSQPHLGSVFDGIGCLEFSPVEETVESTAPALDGVGAPNDAEARKRYICICVYTVFIEGCKIWLCILEC